MNERVGYIIMKDKRKPQIRKNVYLFELDSVRKQMRRLRLHRMRY